MTEEVSKKRKGGVSNSKKEKETLKLNEKHRNNDSNISASDLFFEDRKGNTKKSKKSKSGSFTSISKNEKSKSKQLKKRKREKSKEIDTAETEKDRNESLESKSESKNKKKRKKKKLKVVEEEKISLGHNFTKVDPKKLRDIWGSPSTSLNKNTSRRKETFRKKRESHVKDGTMKLPESGISYNPTKESHEQLLRKAGEYVLKVMKEEKRLKDSIPKPLKKIATPVSEEKKNEEEEEEIPIKDIPNPENRVTRAERNKLKRKRKKELELEALRAEKEMKKQLNAVPKLLSEIKKEEKRQKKLQEQRKNKEKKMRLGKLLLKERMPDVSFSDELKGSIRNLKDNGSILRDQFFKLQERNIIEPRERGNRPQRKYAPRLYNRNKS